MAWYFIVLIVAAVLILVLLLTVAYIELKMFLAPKSFWWKLIHKERPQEEKTLTAEEQQEADNESRLRAQAAEWAERTPHSEQHIRSKDRLTLTAFRYLRADSGHGQSHKWAICVHGYTGNAQTMTCYAQHYFEGGFNVLLPDNRTHGKSEGQYIGMGWLDKDDLILWIDSILNADPDAQIVLHGESMGSATVMMASGCPLPPNVRCIIADCGYTSVWDEFVHVRTQDMHLRSFPVMYVASFIARFVAGYSLRGASSVRQLRKSRTPTLFVHGEEDTFVPCRMIHENFGACAAPKQMRTFPHAKHCQSEFYNPDEYWKTVDGFTGIYMQ